MKETRTLTCIGCPMGCQLTVALDRGVVAAVTGNTCQRGDAYARREVVCPTRVLTTTVPVIGGDHPTVPVRTAGEVPKALLLRCAGAVKELRVAAPVTAGQVLCPDLCGTGVALIAVGDVEAVE